MKITIEFASLDEIQAFLEWAPRKATLPRGSLDALELDSRTLNCLRAEGIFQIEDLVVKTEHELIRAPNLGRKSLNAIKEQLAKRGWCLGTVVGP